MVSIEKAVQIALAEDIGRGDVTTNAIVPEDLTLNGRFIAKASGIIAGLEAACQTFQILDPSVQFAAQTNDGDLIQPGEVIATVSGSARSILSAERVALNFLQRMSGIASLTCRYVEAVAGTGVVILDTRKTAPGLRTADKLAVSLGGGQNHRFGLDDMALIKENHITAVNGDLAEALDRVKVYAPDIPIEIEVTNLEQLKTALTLPVDRIMLDNMSLEEMRTAVTITNGKIPLEASGNVTLQTVRAIAETGVNYISVGALTHSVTALDISLLLE